jgi:hypothetical protein
MVPKCYRIKTFFSNLLLLCLFSLFSLYATDVTAIGVKNCGPVYIDYQPYKDNELNYEIVRAELFDTTIEGPFAENY